MTALGEGILRLAIETCPDGMMVVSPEGELISFNRRFVEMWRLSDGPAVAGGTGEATFRAVLDRLAEPELLAVRVRSAWQGPDERSCGELLLKDGRTFQRHAAPLVGDDGASHGRVFYFRDVTESKQVEQTLRYHDALLRGVAAATNRLLTLTDFDAAINAALRTIGDAAGADRVYLFQNQTDARTGRRLASQRFEWCADGVTTQSDNPRLQNMPYDCLPRWEQALVAGRAVGGRVADFPPDERGLFESQGIVSVLCVPITLGGEFWGFVGFDDCRRRRREWGEAEVSILVTMAGGIAGALVRRRTEAELQYDSLHDALTGLPNRLLFTDRLNQCLARAKRREDYRFAVLFLDLDRFKVINDSLGHSVGDKLLVATAERLANCVRGTDSVARPASVRGTPDGRSDDAPAAGARRQHRR